MKYRKITWGKMEAVINKIGGEEGMDRLLAGELKVVPVSGDAARPVRKQGALTRDGSFSAVTLTKRFDPREFYRDRQGLYVWSDFSTRILPAANPVAGSGFKRTTSWTLVKGATGQDLLSERPKDVWQATSFCAWLSVKLDKQSRGESGELLNTGYANLFLVKGVNGSVFVVFVHWDSVGRKWLVHTWPLGVGWDAGHRFVSKPIAL